MKPTKTILRKEGDKYVIDYWTEQEPDQSDQLFDIHDRGEVNFDESKYDHYINQWQQSKKTVPVHDSCVESFKNLIEGQDFYRSQSGGFELGVGIEIPSENVEIREIYKSNSKCLEINAGNIVNCTSIEYAFLKEKGETRQEKFDKILSELSKEEIEEWLSTDNQDELWNEMFCVLENSLQGRLYKHKLEALKQKFTITKKP